MESKRKLTKKKKPIFYLLEEDGNIQKMSSISSTPNSSIQTIKTNIKTNKKKIKTNNKSKTMKKVDLIITNEPEKTNTIDIIEVKSKTKSKSKKSIIDEKEDIKEKKRRNEDLIELMDTLANLMLKKGEIFKARAYQKAQESILNIEEDIVELNQLKGLPGIGSTILEKVNEYFTTGTLKLIEREKDNPANLLTEIYGIGPKKAKELVAAGVINFEILEERQNELLNDVQKVGLKYKNDILKRIPREEIHAYEEIFKFVFNNEKKQEKNEDAKFEIVGSYRRGAQQSGDIDVIITSPTIKIFNNFINTLIENKIIIEVLSRGTNKCLVITLLPGKNATARRVDFLYTNPSEYAFAVLYFTGSKIFNIAMRQKALNQGFTFNEHGMYHLVNKKKGNQVNHLFLQEKDIFDFLNLEYKEPLERKDGRAVVLKKEGNMLEKDEEKDQGNMLEKDEGNMLEKDEEKDEEKEIVIKNKIEKKKEGKMLGKTEKKEKVIKNKSVKMNTIPKSKENKKSKSKKSIKNSDNIELLTLFKNVGISVLDSASEKELTNLLEYANDTYYNENPLLTDNQYDIIKEYIENKFPKNKALLAIGAPVSKNKVDLPYEMASMDKIKPDTGALESWEKKYKGPYVISCKLDGVSGLYTTEGSIPKLYTRGDGKVGQDISHLIPFLNLPSDKKCVVRGEFVISKEDFNKYLKDTFANPRNLVAGIINQKQIDSNIKYIHFVAYEVIKPELKPSEQLEFINEIKMECVQKEVLKNISNEILSDYLVKWRKDYKYEIDGIIVTDDKIYPRKSGNPAHAFAFKMVLSDQIAEAKVVDVIWTPSKDGYLKPRVRIEPITLGGVKIEYATGFNAAFIKDNKIGIGALIEIIRSGDVIPHIKSIIIPAEEAKMPSLQYQWNNTMVDIILEDINDNLTVKEKNITFFFKGLEVEGLSSGNVSRLIKAGYDSIPKILKMEESDFLQVEGFKHKLAHKLYNGIKDKIKNANLIELMSKSNLFGRGISEKKMELILEEYPDILVSTLPLEDKIKNLNKIKGMAQKSTESFVKNIETFVDFIKEIGLEDKLMFVKKENNNVIHKENPLFDKKIILTGLRDKEIISLINQLGGIVSNSVNKNTFLVIAKTNDEDTSKANEARKLDIPIMGPEEFIQKYQSFL